MTRRRSEITSGTEEDSDLGQRVRASLRAQAAQIDRDSPFDPAASPTHLEGVGQRRSRFVTARAAAAVLVIVGLAAAVAVVTTTRADTDQSVATQPGPEPADPSTASPTTTAAADPVAPDLGHGVVPSTVPAGLQLWSITWGPEAWASNQKAQLFALDEDPAARLLVVLDPANPGSSAGGSPVTVRGQSGSTAPSKESSDRSTTIAWQEEASVQARYVGMSEEQALELLDGLTWRSGDHLEGFSPTALGVALMDETEGEVASQVADRTETIYRDDPASVQPGAGRQLTVRTVAATGGPGIDYLQALLVGDATPDDAAVSYDPSFGTYEVARSDGSSAWIDANATPMTEQELAAVADGLVDRSGADLIELRAQIADRVQASMDLALEVDLPSADVTVRTKDGVEAICISVVPQEWVCDAPGTEQPGSYLIDGSWWVVATAPEEVVLADRSDRIESLPPEAILPSETTVVDGQHVVVANVDESGRRDEVFVLTSADGRNLRRPAF